MYTYVLLEENHSLEQVEARVPDFLAHFYGENGTREEILAQRHLRLQPITDIHLYSTLSAEMGATSDIAYVYIFSAAALLILLLAGVNFVNISTALAFLEAKSGEIVPGHLFTYTFLDDKMDRLYVSEVRMSDLFKAFTQLALIISCLGLFGLSAYSAQQRTKEVGVRKVLGASVPALVVLLSKEFIRLVVIAFVVAAPLAYFGINRWLESFAYRVEVGPMVFFVALVSVLVIAWLSVSYQAIRAARVNPVESLKYE